MAAPLFFPRFRAFSQDGIPLAGGFLYSYIATTATPQDTYTDSTLATPNANPVELDANGEASVWIGTALYKFVLTDSDNVTQWTVDNVSESGVTGTVPTGTFQPVSVFYDAGNTGTALSIDWSNGQQQQFTLTGNPTITLGNPTLPGWYTLKPIQNATGGWTITWAGAQYSASRWINNSAAPVLCKVASTEEMIYLFWDGSKWYMRHVGPVARKNVYVASVYRTTSTQVIGTGASANVIFNAATTDPYSEWTLASGVFTAKVAGLYRIEYLVTIQVATGGNTLTMGPAIGGTSVYQDTFVPTDLNAHNVAYASSWTQQMAAGDTAFVNITNNTSGNATIAVGSTCAVTRLGD